MILDFTRHLVMLPMLLGLFAWLVAVTSRIYCVFVKFPVYHISRYTQLVNFSLC